eukprot:scaffold14219_cov59-Phaeocystis_antarctica.AAC.7
MTGRDVPYTCTPLATRDLGRVPRQKRVTRDRRDCACEQGGALGVAGAARVVWVGREAPTVDVPCADGQHHAYVPPQVAGADAVQCEPRSAPPLGESSHEEDGETEAV